MRAVLRNTIVSIHDGPCSDCGHMTASRTRCFDQHTSSMVELCANCVPAFLQRRHFVAGSCGDL